MVELSLNAEDLGVWDAEMKYVVEPGTFEVMVGGSSEDGLRGMVEVG